MLSLKRVTWSFEEEETLKMLLHLSIEEIAKKLDKNVETIISKLKQLRKNGSIDKKYKIKNETDNSNLSIIQTEWEQFEVDKLIINIKSMGLIKLSKSLNKTTFDTMIKVYELKNQGMIKEIYWNTKDYTDWSKEEDIYLVKHFSSSLREHIIDNLSIKDWKKITRRAKLFGLKRNTHGTMYISPNEKIVQAILQELSISYSFQKRIDYKKNKFFIVDFFINNTNIIFEAQGDYWHGNPKVFTELNDTQKRKIEKDKQRKSILEKMGYQVIYLWEYDLKNNYQQCFNIIKSLCLHKTP